MREQKKNSISLEIDENAIRQAQTLIRTSRFSALSYLIPETGAPMVSQVNVATDINGAPFFLISSLSNHFDALTKDKRCALLFGLPEKGDPAAHPRISVIGSAYKVNNKIDIERLRRRFLARHPYASLYIDFTDFAFWRVQPTQASLNGGFGKAYKLITANLILSDTISCQNLEPIENDIIAHINSNAALLDAINKIKHQTGDWKIISIDCDGFDLMQNEKISRLWFKIPIDNLNDIDQKLIELALSPQSS
ncbi:MAG TPA: hypothetical protein TECP_01196 [Hyphomicrobiaceae bacterium MAG_BT-2024]